MEATPSSVGLPELGVSAPAGTGESGELSTSGTDSSSHSSACTQWNCEFYDPFGSLDEATLTPLFTRTSNGVTVRAFTASWSEAPVELVPVASGSGAASGTGSGSGTGSAPGSGASSSGARSSGVSGSQAGSTTGTDSTIPATTVPDSTTTSTTTLVPGTGVPISAPEPVVPIGCAITHALVVEASDSGAVGVVVVPLGPSTSDPIDVLSDEVIGVSEQGPMEIVVAHTEADTAAVRADFSNGDQDQMNVIGQWAVLVDTLSVSGSSGGGQKSATSQSPASVYALSADGSVLEQASLPGSGALALPVEVCMGATHRSDTSPSSGASSSSSPPAANSSTKAGG